MNQLDRDNLAVPARPSKRWVHKRTWCVLLCFVVLPWILIAIPGTMVGRGGTSGWSVERRWHGWPFVHLTSTRVIADGIWTNRGFIRGLQPADTALNRLAKEQAASMQIDEYYQLKQPQLDLRFHRGDPLIVFPGFWTVADNWPIRRPGLHRTPRYLGLFLNLVTVAMIAFLICTVCEYRIRRQGKLLKLSIINLMILTALAGLVFVWGTRAASRAKADEQLNHSLSQLGDRLDLNYEVEHELFFPHVVSQLMNHGEHPWGSSRLFRHVKSGEIYLSLDEDTSIEQPDRIANLLIQSGFNIHLDVRGLTPEFRDLLNALDGAMVDIHLKITDLTPELRDLLNDLHGANVVSLDIDFDSSVWVYQSIGDDDSETDWEEAVGLANLDLDLNLSLPNLTRLILKLDSTFDQVEQLKPFCGSPLSQAKISWLSKEGAEFISTTAEQWPENIELKFEDDVPVDIQTRLQLELETASESSPPAPDLPSHQDQRKLEIQPTASLLVDDFMNPTTA